MAMMEKRVLLGITRMPFQQPTVHQKQKHKTYRELLQLDRPKRKVVLVSDDENEDYLEKILRPPPNKPKPPPSNIQPPQNSPGTNPQLSLPVESGIPGKRVSRSSCRNTLRKEIYIDDGSKVYKYNPPFGSAHLVFLSSLHPQVRGRASLRNMRPLHVQRRIGPQGLVHVLKEERQGGESRRRRGSATVPLRMQPWGNPEQKRIVDRERLFKDAQQQELFLRSLQ